MLSFLQSSLIVLCSIASALFLLRVLHRVWPLQFRKPHNDLIGWQIGSLGTTYAVIIAFMLSGVWSDFQAAEANSEVEANSLLAVYRMADGMPVSPCTQLKSMVRRYAYLMIQDEWPAMYNGTLRDDGVHLLQDMWKVIIQTQPQTPGQEAIFNRLITELSNLTEHNRVRQLQFRSQLPSLFWLVLISGAVITVGYTCLLGIESRRIQVLQVGTTAFMISLILVTIADIDQPFRGAIRVSPAPFQAALHIFNTAP